MLLVALACPLADAAPSPDSAEGRRAAALLQEGKDLLGRGELSAACGKFSESVAVAPFVGSLGSLADCEEQQGKLLAARGHWAEAIAIATAERDDRLSVVRSRAEQLEGRIPRLGVRLAPGAPAGTHATRGAGVDAVVIEPGGEGEVLDPGRYEIVVSAPGHRPRRYEIVLGTSDRKIIDVEPGPAMAASSADGPSEPAQAAATDDKWSDWTTAGIVVGGAGVVTLVIGAIFGGQALSKQGDAEPHCDASNFCDDEGLTLRDEGIEAGNVSTGLIVAGSVLLAGGIGLLVAAPNIDAEPEPTTALLLGPGVVRVIARW